MWKKTGVYSVLHMFVDGMCAFAVFGNFFGKTFSFSVLLVYNFCAFVLQMPIGLLYDFLRDRFMNEAFLKGMDFEHDRKWLWLKKENFAEKMPVFFVLTGVLLVITGAFFSPVLLGVGNAFFHIGGGVGNIREDFRYEMGGKELGVFVAPGAFGLFLGGQAGKMFSKSFFSGACLCTGGLMLLLTGVLFFLTGKEEKRGMEGRRKKESSMVVTEKNEVSFSVREIFVILSCFLVVLLRSYTGFFVSMPWKEGFTPGLFSVLAIVSGKAFGGVLAADLGIKEVIVLSLSMAAAGYWFSDEMIPGLMALFFFNMTMPVTLYLLVRRWKEWSGFFFGLLTVALFAGYLPYYFQMPHLISGQCLGAVVSICSLLLLYLAMKMTEDKG